jgi:hypothetical protein
MEGHSTGMGVAAMKARARSREGSGGEDVGADDGGDERATENLGGERRKAERAPLCTPTLHT